MARPRKYATAEERATACKLQKLAWFHRNAIKLNAKRRQSYREARLKSASTSPRSAQEDTPYLNSGTTAKERETRRVSESPRSAQDRTPSDCPNAKARTVKTNWSVSDTRPAVIAVAKTVSVDLAGAGASAFGRSQNPDRQRFVAASPPEALVVTNAPSGSRRIVPCVPGTSKYWVTRSITLLKVQFKQYETVTSEELNANKTSYADYCAFWEEALGHFLPPEGLRKWGALLFVELSRSNPDPELDPRTTAKRECTRLSWEISVLDHIVTRLERNVFDVDPFARAGLTSRAQKLNRTVSLLGNIIDELLILHDNGLDLLLESEKDGMLNYQVAKL